MRISGAILLCLCACCVSVLGNVANPLGYLVGRYTQYSFCDGGTTSMSVQAIGRCVYGGGLIGYPYQDLYYIFSPVAYQNGLPYVTATYYNDNQCQVYSGQTTLPINGCTDSGSSVYFTYSPTLPTLSGGSVVQITNDYTGALTSNCPTNATVLSMFMFYDGCLFNCGAGPQSCKFYGCSPGSNMSGVGTALYSVFSEEYCPVDGFYSTSTMESDCTQSIVCLPQSSSSSSGVIRTPAVIGVTFISTVIGVVIIQGLLFLYCYRCKKQSPASEPLNQPGKNLLPEEQHPAYIAPAYAQAVPASPSAPPVYKMAGAV